MSEVLDTQTCIEQLSGTVDSEIIQRTLLHSGDWCANSCVGGPAAPAASQWGLVVMAVIILIAGTIVANKRATERTTTAKSS
jgi:hypothetical protein